MNTSVKIKINTGTEKTTYKGVPLSVAYQLKRTIKDMTGEVGAIRKLSPIDAWLKVNCTTHNPCTEATVDELYADFQAFAAITINRDGFIQVLREKGFSFWYAAGFDGVAGIALNSWQRDGGADHDD